jgi:hypothetical protein
MGSHDKKEYTHSSAGDIEKIEFPCLNKRREKKR